jgi:hypothetical protein
MAHRINILRLREEDTEKRRRNPDSADLISAVENLAEAKFLNDIHGEFSTKTSSASTLWRISAPPKFSG